MLTDPNKFDKESYRTILESLTPAELAVEYARATGESPPDAAAPGDLIQRVIAEFYLASSGQS